MTLLKLWCFQMHLMRFTFLVFSEISNNYCLTFSSICFLTKTCRFCFCLFVFGCLLSQQSSVFVSFSFWLLIYLFDKYKPTSPYMLLGNCSVVPLQAEVHYSTLGLHFSFISWFPDLLPVIVHQRHFSASFITSRSFFFSVRVHFKDALLSEMCFYVLNLVFLYWLHSIFIEEG